MSVVGGINENSKLKGEDIARIAVDIYNREQNTHLEFWKVLDDSTTERVDDGMTYHIIFKAANSGSMNTYKATVLVHLVDFKPIDPPTLVPVDDIYVKFAGFAVDEHNMEQTPKAELWKVLTADKVPKKIDEHGIMYFIVLKTVEGDLVGTNEADVWVKLEEFTPVNAATSA